MRSIRRFGAVLGVGAAVLAGSVTAAQADSPAAAIPLVNPETGGHYALYDGELIDLSQGWQGATICVEQVDYSMVCYDDEADYRAAEGLPATEELPATTTEGPSPFSRSDCPNAYLCLWDNRAFDTTGGMLKFRQAGYKDLADYGFADKANSVYNNRETRSDLLDLKDCEDGACYYYNLEMPDHGSWFSDLGEVTKDRDDGKNWNNKIDEVHLESL